MARELPIRNGRLTTDLDAAGHKIKNLPPGEGFTQEQADWNQSDSTKPDFIKNKPAIPAPVTVDSALSATSENPVQNKVVTAAVNARPTKAQIEAGWWSEWKVEDAYGEVDYGQMVYDNGTWTFDNGDVTYTASGTEDATSLTLVNGDLIRTATRHRVAAPVPTKTSDLTNDGSDGEHPFISQHQQLAPVYGGNGQRFSEWMPDDSLSHAILWDGSKWEVVDQGGFDPPECYDFDATSISSQDLGFTATRTENQIIGYTLGGQTTKPLQPQGNYLTQHQSLAGLMPMYPFSEPTMQQTGDWKFSGTSAGDGYHWEPVYGSFTWSLYKVSDSDPSDRTDMGDDTGDVESAAVLEFLNTGVIATRGYVCNLSPFTNAKIEMGWTFDISEPYIEAGSLTYSSGTWTLVLTSGDAQETLTAEGQEDAMMLVFSGSFVAIPITVTATRPPSAFEIAVGALPTGVTGKARDCILVIDCTATGAVAPTVTWGTHFHPRTDVATDLAIVEAGKRAVFYISEYASGEFAVGGWVETAGGSGT